MNKRASDIAKQQMEPEQHFRAIITAPGLLEIEHMLTAPTALKGKELEEFLKNQVRDFIKQTRLPQADKLFVKIEQFDRQGRGLGLSKKLGMSL